jgi:hypothetical protein
MINPYGITFDDYSLRWAAAEGVPEAVIAAICLIGAKTVDEIVAKLTPAELGQVVNIVGRSPSCYPPGVYAALKSKRDLASPPPRADSPPPKEALKKEARRPPERQPTSTLGALGHRKRLQPYVSVMPPTAKTGRPPTSEGFLATRYPRAGSSFPRNRGDNGQACEARRRIRAHTGNIPDLAAT